MLQGDYRGLAADTFSGNKLLRDSRVGVSLEFSPFACQYMRCGGSCQHGFHPIGRSGRNALAGRATRTCVQPALSAHFLTSLSLSCSLAKRTGGNCLTEPLRITSLQRTASALPRCLASLACTITFGRAKNCVPHAGHMPLSSIKCGMVDLMLCLIRLC